MKALLMILIFFPGVLSAQVELDLQLCREMAIRNSKEMEIADRISMQMISTDLTVPPDKLILKKSEKQGWFQAMEVASSWLDRMDNKKL